ncbi:hypothetical protein ACIGZJ_06040 [Kitasatospora sp. NPDC052868]|uniref:hypothetical protein n=1 Tax=Kitasatospora sp. NPDC052868 TaxID=3364060 RepID=UPI0037CA6F51
MAATRTLGRGVLVAVNGRRPMHRWRAVVALRVKPAVLAVAGLVLVGAVAAAGWWLIWESDRPELKGTWRSGSYLLELNPGGSVGSSSLPAGVCAGSRYTPKETLIELEGSWVEEFEADAGHGVRVKAVRKDGAGKCTFWAAYVAYDGRTELQFAMDPSPVKSLEKAS